MAEVSRLQINFPFNGSWVLAASVIGIIIVFKFDKIKKILFQFHELDDGLEKLMIERDIHDKMKEETTRKFYKRIIPEEEFKSLIKDYDSHIIYLESQIAEEKGKRTGRKRK